MNTIGWQSRSSASRENYNKGTNGCEVSLTAHIDDSNSLVSVLIAAEPVSLFVLSD
jgi:hypothetical protein